MPDLCRRLQLLLGECWPLCDVGAAVCDATVDELGNSCALEADIGDDEFCSVGVGEHSDRCFVPCGCGGNLSADAGGIEAHAMLDDAVVGGEDEDPGPRVRRWQ